MWKERKKHLEKKKVFFGICFPATTAILDQIWFVDKLELDDFQSTVQIAGLLVDENRGRFTVSVDIKTKWA